MCPKKYKGEEKRGGEPCCKDLTDTKTELYKLKWKVVWFGGAMSILVIILTGVVFPASFKIASKLTAMSEKQVEISTNINNMKTAIRDLESEVKAIGGRYIPKKR